MELFKNTNFDFLGKKWPFIGLSLVLSAAGLISMGMKGMRYGIDFKGGAQIWLRFAQEPPVQQIRSALESKLPGEISVQQVTGKPEVLIGTEIKDWRKLDFPNLKGRSLLAGKELASGPGSAVMGSALISLAWLANKLNEHGRQLRAGDLVLTGSVHPPAFLPGKGIARTEFEGLGGTEITIR